jgi:hypothetical protein
MGTQAMTHRPVFKFASYDTAKYPLAETVARDVLHVADLSRYHEHFLQGKTAQPGRPLITYQDNMVARERLKTMDPDCEYYRLQRKLMEEVVTPLFDCEVLYIRPVFRVQMAGSGSVSDWHRDIDVTGQAKMITAWIPFVDTFDTNTLWVEQEYGKADYVPIPVRYGEIFMFDSAWLRHGSVPNQTPFTRVSVDIRVVPLKQVSARSDLGIFRARPDWCTEENIEPVDRPKSRPTEEVRGTT